LGIDASGWTLLGIAAVSAVAYAYRQSAEFWKEAWVALIAALAFGGIFAFGGILLVRTVNPLRSLGLILAVIIVGYNYARTNWKDDGRR
jgi:hypothetical protein